MIGDDGEIDEMILQLAAVAQEGRTRRTMIIGGQAVVLPRRDHHHGDAGAGQVVLPAATTSRYSDH
jgi:hypothetical protein